MRSRCVVIQADGQGKSAVSEPQIIAAHDYSKDIAEGPREKAAGN